MSCDTDFIYLITAYFPNPDMWESDFKTKKGGGVIMVCMECGAKTEKGYTTSVTDLGSCLLIV